LEVSVQKSKQPIVVDGAGHIAGRLASIVAKKLLEGGRVVVVNTEKIMFSGSIDSIRREWEARLEITSATNPKHTPVHPRRPDRIFARMVRGMVPRKKPKGRMALKRLRTYIGVPEEYKNAEKVVFKEAMITKPAAYYVSLAELAKLIGWRGE